MKSNILLISLVAILGSVSLPAGAVTAPVSSKNNGKPIEINADSLEVLQENNKAIFTGHVVSVQGDVRLKADRMIVHYRQQNKDGKKDKPVDGQGAVSKIETEGNVFMSTPRETARGARGTYDVDKKVINLYDNVVLTRGQNVLKGDALVYNLESGQSKVTTNASSAASATGAPAKQRVHAILIPEKNKDADKK